jgi:dihydropteroate synthase
VTLTYGEALAAIADRGRYGIRLGLGRTRALLRELGDPQAGLRGALVAGTNGKGSVLALAGAALRAAGHRVAETPKPHLVSYRERAVLDGRPIPAAAFARLAGEVLAAADRIERRHGPPTEFEVVTALAFRWFADARPAPDVALIEVGLGGRLDATHAWDGGVAVVTNVGLDHMDRLGSTIAAIAREKAAIIERGDLAVTGTTGEALEIVRRRCRRLRVTLTETLPAPIVGVRRDGIEVELEDVGRTLVGLRGRHQAANVTVADAMLDALEAAAIVTCPRPARRSGYASARWPGRLELIEAAGRDIVLDGAHNPAGAASLAASLDDLAPFLSPGRLTLVTAAMADKDVAGIAEALARSRLVADAIVVCTAVEGGRAMSPADLADAWRSVVGGRVRTAPDPAGRRRARPRRGVAVPCRRRPGPPRRRPGAARPRGGDPTTMTAPAGARGETLIGGRRFGWGERTYLMGIVNVTPDSFSGDGLLKGPAGDPVAAAAAQARRMAEEGADILDVGGESSRPGHEAVDEDEELRRVIPVVAAIAAALPAVPISVDTTKTSVAAAAIDAGAAMLNDIWGVDPAHALARLAAERGIPIVLMHNRSEPRYDDVVAEVVADLDRAVEGAMRAGVDEDGIVVDPGIGFGKTAEHNLEILRRLDALRSLGRPILLGTSRKSTIGKVLDLPPGDRLEGTLATTALGIAHGADLVRVHDVAPNVRAARMTDAIVRGWSEPVTS